MLVTPQACVNVHSGCTLSPQSWARKHLVTANHLILTDRFMVCPSYPRCIACWLVWGRGCHPNDSILHDGYDSRRLRRGIGSNHILFSDLKVLAIISHFKFHFFPHLLTFLQFRDPLCVLNLSTKTVLQKWHIQCTRAKYLQFELIFRWA